MPDGDKGSKVSQEAGRPENQPKTSMLSNVEYTKPIINLSGPPIGQHGLEGIRRSSIIKNSDLIVFFS